MPFNTTILKKKIEGLKEAFQTGRFGDALVTALNIGNGLLQQRIFTDNKDIQGNSFGSYVGKKRKARLLRSSNKTQDKRNKAIAGKELTPYQRKRALKGRQIIRKDLEFSGGLRRAIDTQVESEKSAILQFNTDLAAKIARGQENQITNIRSGSSGTTRGSGVPIFKLNQSEREQIVEQGRELIKEILKKNKR